MRETRLYGSVRGAAGNNRPYREHQTPIKLGAATRLATAPKPGQSQRTVAL